jgi:phage-related protein
MVPNYTKIRIKINEMVWYRLIYFFFSGQRIVFLHGFQKKTEKTPRREVEIALQRLHDFVRREEKERSHDAKETR